MDIKEFEQARKNLEQDYNEIEKKIEELYKEGKNQKVLELEKKQDIIDEQLDVLDEIISNLRNTPKLYDRYLELKKEYNKE